MRRSLLFSGLMTLALASAFVLSTCIDFPQVVVRLEGKQKPQAMGFDLPFMLDSKADTSGFHIQLNLKAKPAEPLELAFSLNGCRPIEIKTQKKSMNIPIPKEFLIHGKNHLSIKGNRSWIFSLIRIQNVFGHSSGLLGYIVISRDFPISGSRLLEHRNGLLWGGLFFLISFLLFFLIGRLNLLFSPSLLKPFSGRIFGVTVLFFLLIPLVPPMLNYRVLFFPESWLVMLAVAALAVVRPITYRRLLRKGFVQIEKIPIALSLFREFLQRRRDLLYPLAAASISFAMYVRTLLPGIGYSGDTAKFQFIGKILGVPHCTGYPLYIILNKLFIQIPIGSIAFRVNLLSAVFASLAVLFLFLSIRFIIERREIAFLASLLFAFTRQFWSQAVIAEVYTLNAFLVILVIYLLIKWGKTRSSKFFYGFLIVYSLSFGNHLTMITIFPALFIYAWMTDRKFVFRPRTILFAIGSVIIGAGQYFLLYIRSIQKALYVEINVIDFRNFWFLVTGKQFQNQMFSTPWTEVITVKFVKFLSRISAEMLLPFLLLAVIGMVVLFRRERRIAFLSLFALLGEMVFILNYEIPDISLYYIPVVLIAFIPTATGLVWLIAVWNKKSFRRFLIGLTFCGVIFLVLLNFRDVDKSLDIDAEEKYAAFFRFVEKDSAIATDNYWEKMYVLNGIFLRTPRKRLFQFDFDTENHAEVRWQITANLLYVFGKGSPLQALKKRRMYLISDWTNRAFSSQGIQTIPVLLETARGKPFYVYRVIYPPHLFF